MLGYTKQHFEVLINRIEGDIAYVTVYDEKGDMSFMEIYDGDLIRARIKFRVGVIFAFTLKQFLGWERLTFKPIKRKRISEVEFDAMQKYYEENYGDV